MHHAGRPGYLADPLIPPAGAVDAVGVAASIALRDTDWSRQARATLAENSSTPEVK